MKRNASWRLVLGLIAILATLPGTISAQTEIGFRGGLNFATFAGTVISGGDIVVTPESRTGLSLGGFLTLPVFSDFGIQIGAGFTSKGAKVNNTTVRFDYIEIPVLAKISLSREASNLALHFLGGPAISFRIDCSTRTESFLDGSTADSDCDDPLVSGTTLKSNEKTDFGVIIGAGLDVSLAPSTSLLIELMYDIGLPELDRDFANSAKNLVFSILVGMSFKLGG